MNSPTREIFVLIVDDDSLFHLTVKHALKGRFKLKSAYHGEEALAIIRNSAIDAVLLDVQMRSPTEGLEMIDKIRALDADIAIIMSSGLSDFATVREAMRRGANDYVPKDFSPDDLMHTIELTLERRRLKTSLDQQCSETRRSQVKHVMIGNTKPCIEIRTLAEKYKKSSSNVLITGETGAGKEVVARMLRRERADGSLEPFVSVDSSTIQSTTAESLLFGHEKGAFTGAERMNKGIFEEADGGTVYFDEISNMPLEIQTKLLRVIQEKEIKRMGSHKAIPLEFRVVAATNKDLDGMVARGEFKGDLLQRINVLPITIPPLRERKEDIALLVTHFCALHAPHRPNAQFMPDALERMKGYDWPGNIRELSNVVAYILTMSENDEIEISDLPPKLRSLGASGVLKSIDVNSNDQVPFYDRVAMFEAELLKKEYQGFEGNVSRMALKLGMDRSHLYTKLREHGILAKKA